MESICTSFDWCSKLNLEHVKLQVSADNVMIVDSYKIRRLKYMLDVINYIKTLNNTIISKRKTLSLLSEWRAHNLLYWMGIERERTMHCDLNFENSFKKFLYMILSIFYIGQ
jgi:hypothetical protein